MQLCVVTLLQLAIIHPVGVWWSRSLSPWSGEDLPLTVPVFLHMERMRVIAGLVPVIFCWPAHRPLGYHGLLAHQEEDAMANQPEVTLWSSVLMQAVVDLDNPVERGGSMEWFKALGEGVGSFRWVAFMLDMDPKRLRERIMARDKARRGMARKVMRAPRRWQRRGYPQPHEWRKECRRPWQHNLVSDQFPLPDSAMAAAAFLARSRDSPIAPRISISPSTSV